MAGKQSRTGDPLRKQPDLAFVPIVGASLRWYQGASAHTVAILSTSCSRSPWLHNPRAPGALWAQRTYTSAWGARLTLKSRSHPPTGRRRRV